MRFDHQLIDRSQLCVVKAAYFLGFNVGHIHRACVLEVLKCLGDEQTEHFQVRSLDFIEDLQTFGSEILGQLRCLSLIQSMYVLRECVEEEGVDACPAPAGFVVLVRVGLCIDIGRRRE